MPRGGLSVPYSSAVCAVDVTTFHFLLHALHRIHVFTVYNFRIYIYICFSSEWSFCPCFCVCFCFCFFCLAAVAASVCGVSCFFSSASHEENGGGGKAR